jgi:hypothetical protein
MGFVVNNRLVVEQAAVGRKESAVQGTGSG